MSIEPTTPVIVGCGQINGRKETCREPMDLIERALELALNDCGAPGFQNRVDLIAVSRSGTGGYRNPAGALRDRRKLTGARTLSGNFGGHTPQILLGRVAAAIASGDAEAVILAGGELGRDLRMAEQVPVTDAVGADPLVGDAVEDWIYHPSEIGLGINLPVQVYPMLETALAFRHGRSVSAHMEQVAKLWETFSAAAVDNPNAHDRRLHTAKEIATPTPNNRLIYYPYTRLMNSDPFVDQAGVLLLCSVACAQALGIPKDRWVFPWIAAEAHSPFVIERRDLAAAPSLARAGLAITGQTGVAPADMDLVDLYACFPAAVEIQADALQLSIDRPLTVTGGMRFAGGPWNTYTLHMLANLVGCLRDRPESRGLCSGNGGYATRFSVGVYSGTPPPTQFNRIADAFLPTPAERISIDDNADGDCTLEAFSIGHDKRGNPGQAIVACRTPSGSRALGVTRDEKSIAHLLSESPSPRTTVHFRGGKVIAAG